MNIYIIKTYYLVAVICYPYTSSHLGKQKEIRERDVMEVIFVSHMMVSLHGQRVLFMMGLSDK